MGTVGLTIAAVAGFVVVGGLAACSEASSGPEVAKDAVAGTVTAVAGTVTAEGVLSEPPRTLTVDSPIYRDDKILTTAGASVTIVLAHNGARWEIGEGQTHTVSKSVAWRAPKGASGDSLDNKVNDTTAAAGRHSEREAAQGGSTAIANAPSQAVEAASAAEAEPPAAVKPEKSKRKSRPRRPAGTRSSVSKSTGSGARAPGASGGAAPPSRSAISMDDLKSVKGGTLGATSSPPPPPSPRKSGESESAEASAAKPRKSNVSRGAVLPSTLIKQALRSCYVLSDVSGKGKATVSVKFDKNGKITSVSVKAPTALRGLVSCTERKLRGKTVVASKAGGASASASFN